MRETTTYQAFLVEGWQKSWRAAWQEGWREGWQEGFREGWQEAFREVASSLKTTLMELGQRKFGTSAPAEMEDRLAQIDDLSSVLTRLKRILDAKSWEELLN